MGASTNAKEKLKVNPPKFVEQDIKDFVRTSPDNRLSFMSDYVMWDEPLVGFVGEKGLNASEPSPCQFEAVCLSRKLLVVYGLVF